MSSWSKVTVKKYKEKRKHLIDDEYDDYRRQNPRRQKRKRKRDLVWSNKSL